MFVAIKSKEDCSEALETARRYSPNIEIIDQTTLVFDLTGSKAREASRIAAELRERFEAVGVSENLAAALLLARWGREEGCAGEREGGSVGESSDKQTRSSEPKTQNSTLNLEPETLNLPPDLFKIKKSEYRAGHLITSGEEFNARADKERRRKPLGRAGERESESAGGRECGCSGEPTHNPSEAEGFKVKSSRFKVREEEFKVQSSKFKVRNVAVEAKEAGLDQQTLNAEHGTLNAPKAPTLNFEPETLNSRPAEPLARLPIDAISCKAEFLELMDSWAIHDLGAFSQLPEDEMVERFGLQIIELRRQAAGESFRAVNWNVKEDKFFWDKELEGTIETIEPLNFVLSKGVAQIFRNLDYVGLSTQSAKITLRGRKKKKVYRIRLVFPTKNQKIWIRQIVTKIELDLPGFNIDHVEIVFRSTKPRTVQNNLYSGVILEPENLNLIVTKLKKVVGLTKIGLPKLRDSWNDPFYMTEDLSPLIRDTGTRGYGDAGSGCSGVRECERAGEVSGFRFQVSGLSKQTQNPKPKTQNSLSTKRDSGDAGECECERAGVREGACSREQTRNQTPETRNSVPSTRANPWVSGGSSEQTRNQKLETRNPLVSTFYYLPQPVKARVFFESGEPKALIIKGKRELVRTSGGPWRKDAEWYGAKKWQRDEWDIETETGAVYRVFTDKNGEAFVDGGYD